MATLPLVPAEDIKVEYKMISEAPAGENPKFYFNALSRVNELRNLVHKGDYASVGVDNKMPYRGLIGLRVIGLHQRYIEKFGYDALGSAREEWTREHGRDPFTTRSDTDPVGLVLWRMYVTGLPFALLFFLVRFDALGHSLLVEMLAPWQLLLALVCWPVGIFKYPNGEPTRQMVRAMRFAAFTLTTVLSGFAGTAVAQTTSPSKERRKDDPHTLQFDFRSSDALGDGAPDIFLRATAITSRGFYFETIDTARSDRWNLSGLAGPRVVKTKTLTGYVVGGLSRNSLGASTAFGGIQAFYNTKRFSLLIPALHYERRLGSHTDSVATAVFVVGKTTRYRYGLDLFFKKTDGLKPQWSAGTLFGRNTPKGFVEAAVLRNSLGEWRVRGRYVHSFAW